MTEGKASRVEAPRNEDFGLRLMESKASPDMESVDELTEEFLAESREGLDRMDRCLIELETRPDDSDLLGEIFRAVHTIKGTTGFLGFSRLEKLAHAGEHVLGLLRNGILRADPELVDCLLQLMDRLREILRLIEHTGKEGTRAADNDDSLIALLATFGGNEHAEIDDGKGSKGSGEQAPVAPLAPADPGPGEGKPDAEQTDVVAKALKLEAIHSRTSGTSEKTLRIDAEVLNRMMNLVGELVLTRNQILQSQVDAANFPELARRLDSVTADLRETVMQARMQSVGHLFGKFPRMVRDVAKSCGKNVRLEFFGQETGLDKSLLEAIKDPLTHAVRNAIDHGIEEPSQRMLAGKISEGLVSLRAYQQGGSVVIEVADDGGGISIGRVLEKAVERGLISDARAASMTQREALQLIFLPGFSTAAEVTHVSGRGVGMDVVRANVEKVGGTVEVESREGVGTILRLRMPLTLAIVPALVVRSGGQSFCLPQASLAELVYVPLREAETAIERIGEAKLYRLRDSLLPLVWLDRLLDLERREAAGEALGLYIAVLEAEGCRYGLVIDDLMAPEEIVVKPLSSVLREIGLFSGATVLGNGMLAMILDVSATAIRAGIRSEGEPDAAPALSRVEDKEVARSFVIFEERVNGQRSERRALPLRSVERIESIAVSRVEYVGGSAFLQYRGELLPLEDTGGVLPELAEKDPKASATILICIRPSQGQQARGQKVGMVVRSVVDIASGHFLEQEVATCDEKLALVGNQLMGVHRAFAQSESWQEVA